ncbi:ACT domain-containing protein ACR12-like protein isoform X1 [Tanacetum coccineum]
MSEAKRAYHNCCQGGKDGMASGLPELTQSFNIELHKASVDGVDSLGLSALDADIPTPIVLIDQDSDPSATIVQVSFGDRLGALIDMIITTENIEQQSKALICVMCCEETRCGGVMSEAYGLWSVGEGI